MACSTLASPIHENLTAAAVEASKSEPVLGTEAEPAFRSASLSPPVKKDLSSIAINLEASESTSHEPLKRQFVIQTPNGKPIITISKPLASGEIRPQGYGPPIPDRLPNVIIASGPHPEAPQNGILSSVQSTAQNIYSRLTNITFPHLFGPASAVAVTTPDQQNKVTNSTKVEAQKVEIETAEDFEEDSKKRQGQGVIASSSDVMTLIPSITVPSFTIPSVSVALNMKPVVGGGGDLAQQFAIAAQSSTFFSNSSSGGERPFVFPMEIFNVAQYGTPEAHTKPDPTSTTEAVQLGVSKLLEVISLLVAAQAQHAAAGNPVLVPVPVQKLEQKQNASSSALEVPLAQNFVPAPFHSVIPILNNENQGKSEPQEGNNGKNDSNSIVPVNPPKKFGNGSKPTKARPIYGYQAPEYKPKPSPSEKINAILKEVNRIVSNAMIL